MIDCLIFSKDRACQLDLLLRSIKDNFNDINNLNILYLSTKNFYKDGYDLVKKYHAEYNWIKENDFFKDVLNIFKSFKNDFLVNFVDDEIVIRSFSIKSAYKFLNLDNTHCVSLRQAPYMNYCYTADLPDPQPNFIEMNIDDCKLFVWDWRTRSCLTDWGYPSCINSHIYKTKDFLRYILQINFRNPNELEGMFNNMRMNFKKYNACFLKSKTLNISNNLTQTGINRHGNKMEFSLENLNNQFLKGKRLKSEIFYNIEKSCATFEKDYEWEN